MGYEIYIICKLYYTYVHFKVDFNELTGECNYEHITYKNEM